MTLASQPEGPPFKITPVVLHILLAVGDRELHGYAIMQEIAARTRGSVRVGPGSLYFTLNRLLDAELIEECAGTASPGDDDARRKYYRLTEAGRAVLEAELVLMSEIVESARARRLLDDPSPA